MRYAPLAEAADTITKEIGEVLREKTADVVVEDLQKKLLGARPLGVWHGNRLRLRGNGVRRGKA